MFAVLLTLSCLLCSRSDLSVGKQVPGQQNQPVAGQPTTTMPVAVALAQFIVLIGSFDLEFTEYKLITT